MDYGLKNGKRVEHVGWAARVVFAKGKEIKMKRYQVSSVYSCSLAPC